ncbi:DUF969 domain-containing protein [bacterium]|nr:DUF969 domain-containing protein [bacterium]MCI0607157.1 DUF969 domain-containing protein [bacterium]
MSEWFKLIGIVIVIVGFALKLRTTLVVVAAALATGLIAGLPLFSSVANPGQEGLINMLGRAFTENRLMTLFIITLPAIGLAERYGLQEQSAVLIRRVRAATVGRLSTLYQLFRVLHGILGLRLTGHASFVRPLIFPMSAGAAEARIEGEMEPEKLEKIKAANSAAENYGNFYGQNLSIVQPGVLLVYGVMKGLGYEVSLWRLVLFTSPIVLFSIVLGVVQFLWLDRRLGRTAKEPVKQ